MNDNKIFDAGIIDFLDAERWAAFPEACSKYMPKLIRLNEERTELFCSFDTDKSMGNPVGNLHGGVISTFFDNAMGALATVNSGGAFTPTASLTVNYLRAVPTGEPVFVRVRVSKAGRSVMYVTGEMFVSADSETPYATASAVYAVMLDKKVRWDV